MNEIVSYLMLGILVAFLVALIDGMLFGMIRGPKRTTKRILVLFCSFIIALLITPLISGALLNLSAIDRLMDKLLDGLQGGNSGDQVNTVASFLTSGDDITALMYSLPIILINITVFLVLLTLFRLVISPIIEVTLLRKIAPKKDVDGNKIKYNIWAGLGMGAVQGLVIFAFFFIPVTGLMSSLNKIDKYEPNFGGVRIDATATGTAGFDDMNQVIRELNEDVQGSPIGVISRISGMQFLGDIGLRYLTNVKSLNIKNEVENSFELSRDFIAIYQRFSEVEDLHQLIPLFSDGRNVDYLKYVVNKVFKLGITKIVLNSKIGEFARSEDLLSKVDLNVADDQAAYNQNIYKALENLNADFVREDLLSIIELMRLLFAEYQLEGTTARVSLYHDFDNLMFVLNSDEVSSAVPIMVDGVKYTDRQAVLKYVFENLEVTLSKIKFGTGAAQKNMMQQILHVFGNMNIFKKLLLDKNNPELYSIPLAKLLNIPAEDAALDFDRVLSGVGDITIRLVGMGPTVYKLVNVSDAIEFADILNENDGAAVEALGEILEILTNRGDENGIYNGNRVMGTGSILRKLIADSLTKSLKGTEGSYVSFDVVLGSLVSKLAVDGPDIDWADELNAIRQVVAGLGDILSGEINADELLNKILGGDLLDIIAESEILSDIIKDVVDETLNGALDGKAVHFNFDGVTNSAALIRALGKLVSEGNDIAVWMQDGMAGEEFNNLEEIIDLLGGDSQGENSAIVLLAESGVKIEIGGNNEGLAAQLAAYQLEHSEPADPLSKIAFLFVFK